MQFDIDASVIYIPTSTYFIGDTLEIFNRKCSAPFPACAYLHASRGNGRCGHSSAWHQPTSCHLAIHRRSACLWSSRYEEERKGNIDGELERFDLCS